MDELIGKKIGNYEIVGVIGQGGMATVYRAHQVSMNRTVALKVLPRHFLNDETYLQRFMREVKIVSQLEHRNIVPVHDFGEHERQPFIVMRYMSGGSIDDFLRNGPMPFDRIISILQQIAPALDYAHSKDVLHRDLKPSNVLLDDNGGAYITDFGIARVLSETGGTITTQGVIGTPSYMSPEQAQGQQLDGRSDLYSLGVMLFEMVTGRRPFEGDTPYGIAVMQVTTPPPLPRKLNPNLPVSVEEVILTAMKKRREDRYPSAAALSEAFRRAVEMPQNDLQDTQPRYIPITAPAPAPEYRPYTPPQPVQQPVQHRTPPDALRSAPRPRVRRKRSPNLILSAFIGSAIGCVLLTVVIALGILLVQNTNREEEALARTATAEAAMTLTTPTSVPISMDDTPPLNIAGNSTRTPSPTRTPGTVTPFAFTNTPRPATISAITDTPAPIGLRPTETPGLITQTGGALFYFADREGNFDIFRMDLPARTERQISTHFLDDAYPAVSPDGRWIAFQSNRDGDFDIYIMQSNGNNTRRLVQNSVTDRMPTWSPDGEWVTFVSDVRGDGNTDLMRVRPDGTDLEMLYSSGERISSPQWHPDGRSIVFTNGQANNATTWELVLLVLNTRRTTQLTDNHFKDWSPIFSPDGERVLYLTDGEGFSAIGEMEANGENARILFDGAGYESSAVYSPDGTYIAFTSDISGRDEVYLLSTEGEDAEPLTTRGGTQAVWISGQ